MEETEILNGHSYHWHKFNKECISAINARNAAIKSMNEMLQACAQNHEDVE